MLHRCGYALRLNTTDECRSELAGQQWIFGVRLEVAASERAAVQVHSWSQQHPARLGAGLVAEGLAQLFKQRWVPRGAESGTARNVERAALLAEAINERTTRSGRAVAHEHLGNANTRHSSRRPCARAGGKRGLLFDGH